MNYEKIISHEYLDVYRIKDGVLLNVRKYNESRGCWWDVNKNKDKLRKVSGLKNLYVAKEDFEYYKEKHKVGDIFLDGVKINPTQNIDEWFFEVKTTGISFSGGYDEINDTLRFIKHIIEEYKEDK